MKKIIFAAVISAVLTPVLGAAPADLSGQKAALETGSQDARLAAVEALKAERDPAAQTLLASRLPLELDPTVKIQLLEAVDVNAAPAALAGARAALNDANADVQRAAVMCLSRYRRFDAVIPDLQKAFSSAASSGVRSWIINAYGLHSSSSSVAALDAVASDAANAVELRQMALSALGKLGASGKKAAGRHAADKDPVISREAAKASAQAAGKPAAAKPAAAKPAAAKPAAVKKPAPAKPAAAVKKPAAAKAAVKDASVKGTAK